ncbi:MAG: hypothetical protein ABI643_01785 [Candidatus Doudnabacteria bacterium]
MLIKFFDKLEDKVRRRLSHYPIWYGIAGGIGVVLFWRGVWHTTDYIMLRFVYARFYDSSTNLSELIWWDGPLSIVLGSGLLLMIGLFVSNFVGNEIIISGLKGEQKLSEKTVKQLKSESEATREMRRDIKKISAKLDSLK